jgi:hypothetical protein
MIPLGPEGFEQYICKGRAAGHSIEILIILKIDNSVLIRFLSYVPPVFILLSSPHSTRRGGMGALTAAPFSIAPPDPGGPLRAVRRRCRVSG